MLRVTLRGLVAHRLRLATTAVAILLGVAFMAGTLVLTATVGATFDGLWADVNKGVDVQVRSAEVVATDFGDQRGSVDESLVAQVAAVSGVRAVSADITGYAQFVGKDGKAIGNPNQGAPTLGFGWIDSDILNPLRLAEGRPPSGPEEVVMDRATARTGGFVVGDRVTVLTAGGAPEFTIVGITRFGEVDSPLGATLAVFDVPTAQRVLGLPGQLSAVSLTAEDGVTQQELTDRVAAVLPPTVEAITGGTLLAEQRSQTRDQLAFFNTFLLVFAVIALFVGSFIIYNTFSIIVAQRAREMALLRAVGASRRQVLSSVMVEALVTGFLASVLGVVAGLGVAIGLRNLFGLVGIDIPASGLTVEPNAFIVPVAVGVLVTLGSAFFPARKAGRVPPVAAMRDVALDESGRSFTRAVIGFVVVGLGAGLVALGLVVDIAQAAAAVGLGAAVTFLGVAVLGPVIAGPLVRTIGWPLPRMKGIAGRLARENAMRNPTRTSSTAAALMIGVGLVSFIMIVAASASTSISGTVDRAFVGDFVVQSNAGNSGGLPPETAAAIRALPEVAVAAELRTGAARVDGSGTFLPGINGEQFSQVGDLGVEQGSLDDLARLDTIAVHRDTAESKDLRLGSTVPVTFPATGPRELEVVAVYDDKDVAGPWLIGLGTYEANNEVQFDRFVFVKLAPGVSAEKGRAAIAAVADRFPNADLQDRVEFADSIVGQINQLLQLVYVLLALAIIIALIGIANTLALSIFERTRELGLLRAVGMTRRQMRSAVRWEAVIIAVLGAVLGLVVGIAFGWALVTSLRSEGFNTLTVPFLQLLVVVVLAAAAGVLAAVPPARRASRLDVLQAISSE